MTPGILGLLVDSQSIDLALEDVGMAGPTMEQQDLDGDFLNIGQKIKYVERWFSRCLGMRRKNAPGSNLIGIDGEHGAAIIMNRRKENIPDGAHKFVPLSLIATRRRRRMISENVFVDGFDVGHLSRSRKELEEDISDQMDVLLFGGSLE